MRKPVYVRRPPFPVLRGLIGLAVAYVLIRACVARADPLENARKLCHTPATKQTFEAVRQACVTETTLEREQQAKANAEAAAEQRERQARETQNRAEIAQQLSDANADVERSETELKRSCGKHYHAVSPGLSFETAKRCSGPFRPRYADGAATVYESPGGLVRVEHGRITRVFYR